MAFNIDKFKVKPGTKVDLDKISPSDTGGVTKEEALEQVAKNQKRIAELQEMLYAGQKHAEAYFVQGMDCGGKDGAVKMLVDSMNPHGLRVVSLKAPSPRELKQDYLWRVHTVMPGKGEVVVYNRSHYEEVLIVRVNNLVPKSVWEKRYDQINDFEEMLAQNGTHITKFFVHISKEEQLQRLFDRVSDPTKCWKFNEADMDSRAKWDDYKAAYEDVLSNCSTEHAPWYIVPADKKWFRDLVVSTAVVEHLESLNMKYPDPSFDVAAVTAKYFAGMTADADAPKAKKPKPGKSSPQT